MLGGVDARKKSRGSVFPLLKRIKSNDGHQVGGRAAQPAPEAYCLGVNLPGF